MSLKDSPIEESNVTVAMPLKKTPTEKWEGFTEIEETADRTPIQKWEGCYEIEETADRTGCH